MYGMYRKIRNENTGVLTGKGLSYGGSLVRKEATGYGLLYFVEEMLSKYRAETIEGKKVIISGAGKVALHAALKARELGATVVAMSDVNGYVYHKNGLDISLIAKMTETNPEFSTQYKDYHSGAEYGNNPKDVWTKPCDIALPCATQNELPIESAKALVKNGCYLVCEGANMPTTLEATHYLQEKDILFGPGKAANAGGVAVSGLEMTQNAMHTPWTYEELDKKLKDTMKSIFDQAYLQAEKYADPRNLVIGANVAGFMRVYDAMVAQGVI